MSNRQNKAAIQPDYFQTDTLKAIWFKLRKEYFPQRSDLDSYAIKWSGRRQKRVLASCNISIRRVTVARELNYQHWQHWLEPLLFHEMCHAVLADSIKAHLGRRPWHGPEFKALESRHPQVAAMHKWMKEGGWKKAVRSDRARRRKKTAKSALLSWTRLSSLLLRYLIA